MYRGPLLILTTQIIRHIILGRLRIYSATCIVGWDKINKIGLMEYISFSNFRNGLWARESNY